MSNGGARKLNLTLYVNPETSEADRRAVAVLQQWYRQAKQSHSERADLDMLVRLFHRDIYMAGLFLYQLSPRLCRSLALANEEPEARIDSLLQQLEICGLWQAEATAPAASADAQVSAQLEALQQWLQRTLQEQSEAPAAPASVDSSALPEALQQQWQQQQQQMAQMQEQMQQLRQLAEAQSLQLQRLRAAPAASGRAGEASGSPSPAASQSGPQTATLSDVAPDPERLRRIKQKGLF